MSENPAQGRTADEIAADIKSKLPRWRLWFPNEDSGVEISRRDLLALVADRDAARAEAAELRAKNAEFAEVAVACKGEEAGLMDLLGAAERERDALRAELAQFREQLDDRPRKTPPEQMAQDPAFLAKMLAALRGDRDYWLAESRRLTTLIYDNAEDEALRAENAQLRDSLARALRVQSNLDQAKAGVDQVAAEQGEQREWFARMEGRIREVVENNERLRAAIESFIRRVTANPDGSVEWATVGDWLGNFADHVDRWRDNSADAERLRAGLELLAQVRHVSGSAQAAFRSNLRTVDAVLAGADVRDVEVVEAIAAGTWKPGA